MASTPEGKVKDKVKRMLAKFGPEVYSHWPVQNGMGMPTLDCIVCAFGQYIGVETKAEGKKPTPRQEVTMEQMRAAGGIVYVVKNEMDVEHLRLGIEMLKYANNRKQ